MKIGSQKLVAAAARAREGSVSPFSKFKVGAALLTKSGEIIGGANVTDGKKDFVAVAVVARCDGGPMPCGACRQLLAEYAPQAKVFVADSRAPGKIREFTVSGLLPAAFVAVP
jgi:cytidine deaminase